MSRRFVVEADGGSRGNPGPAGYGAVVRDGDTGELLAETAEFLGTVTNNVAEYRGLIAGLRAAHALDPDGEVAVRMDSKLVVEQMSGRWQIKHPDMKPLAAEARSVFPAGRVTYQWIPRHENKHADRLANEAMDAGRRGTPWQPRRPTAASTASAPPARPGAAPARPAVAAAETLPGIEGAALHAQRRAGESGHAPAPASGRADAAAQAVASASSETLPGIDGAAFHAERRAGESGHAPASASGRADAAAEAMVSASSETLPGREAGARAGGGVATEPASAPATSARACGAGRDAGDDGSAEPGRPAAVGIAAVPDTVPDMGTPTTFVLLRHGETLLTPERRFSGSGGSDPDLSEVGRRQAEQAAAALAARGTVQVVVSSPLARCRQTAEVVASRLGLADVRIEPGLRETDFGAFEGLTFAEAKRQYPAELDAWLASTDVAPPGGESMAAVARRVGVARDKLLARYPGRTVLLVSHVTPIKTLVRLALGAPPEALFRMELSAASLSGIQYYADGNCSLRLLNETAHLRP